MRIAFILLAVLAMTGCGGADARGYFAQGAPREQETLGLKRSEADGWTVLSDARNCGNGGEYRLRDAAGAELAVTAPHAFHDRHTGALAMRIFERGSAAAAARNTVARDGSDGCPALDLARESDHLFTQFALGFADRFPGGLVVQLHGFDGGRRSSARAGDAAAIVSNGTASPDAKTLDLADCLSRVLAPGRVLLYPLQTNELGAEDNAQGRALRDAGGARFAHIELSPDVRGELMADDALLDRFANCLAQAAA